MQPSFSENLYKEARGLFPDGAVQTFVAPPKFEPIEMHIDPSVRLVHRPTGTEASCGDYSSQTENYVAAIIRLRIACDKLKA